jgi:hypothetical protein
VLTINSRNEEDIISQWSFLSYDYFLLGPTIKVMHAIANTSQLELSGGIYG